MKIGIDFDGVLVKRQGIPTDSDVWNDSPQEGAIETLKELDNRGIDFYILTNRSEWDFAEIKSWLIKNGYDKKVFITNSKQKGTTIYLDDRAVRFTSWNDFRKLLF